MQSTVILLSLLALAQGAVLSTRIVNGTDVKLGDIPFQVSLQRKGVHGCGGSILNENYVLTAGHCIVSELFPITVVAGTINLKVPGQSRQSVKYIVHEKFNEGNSLANDIALIKVSPPFELNKAVKPVTLPSSHEEVPVGSTAVISGWGDTGGTSHETPDVLKKVAYSIVDSQYCQEAVKSKGYSIYPTQICAVERTNRKGGCSGDSGGPVTVGGKLAGIVSWSVKEYDLCADPKYPDVHTKVSEYIDWIAKNAV